MTTSCPSRTSSKSATRCPAPRGSDEEEIEAGNVHRRWPGTAQTGAAIFRGEQGAGKEEKKVVGIQAMSKLADLISRGIPISAGHFGTDGMAAFVEELKTAPKIECSNVADYIYMGTSQEYWDLRVDFPNIAPPFQRFWMEWKAPKQSNSEGTIISNVNQDLSSRIGFFFNACLTSEMRLPSSKLPPSFRGREEYEKFFREHPEAKWYLTSSCFMLTKDECMVICLPLIHVNLIDASGKWVAHLPTMFGKYATEEEATDLGGNVIALSWPAWLAISFLHCKNVTMETEKVSDALRKATLKRHGVPMHRSRPSTLNRCARCCAARRRPANSTT